MNTVAQSFKQLLNSLKHCPESSLVEKHVDSIAQELLELGERRCLYLETSRHPLQLGTALKLLELQGVRFYSRPRLQGDGFWVLAETRCDSPLAQSNVLRLESTQQWQVAA